MDDQAERSWTAFEGMRCIAAGTLAQVGARAKAVIDAGRAAGVLIFDDRTGETIEVDFRGPPEEVSARLTQPVNRSVPAATATDRAVRGPGRPRLGVVAREVTLLPRHWEWLNRQPGGASVALRKLVEEARRTHSGRDRIRQSQEAACRFMSVMAGNLPGFEEAARALFAGERARFDACLAAWPADVRDHAARLAAAAFAPSTG